MAKPPTSPQKEVRCLAGTGGDWCMRYTKERFIDDFADLEDFFNKAPAGDPGYLAYGD
jgi:hypothetical protein